MATFYKLVNSEKYFFKLYWKLSTAIKFILLMWSVTLAVA